MEWCLRTHPAIRSWAKRSKENIFNSLLTTRARGPALVQHMDSRPMLYSLLKGLPSPALRELAGVGTREPMSGGGAGNTIQETLPMLNASSLLSPLPPHVLSLLILKKDTGSLRGRNSIRVVWDAGLMPVPSCHFGPGRRPAHPVSTLTLPR